MVGTERMPVEAVLCGAVLLTSACRKGGGADPRDFPLPAQNVLDDLSQLPVAIDRVLSNFKEEQQAMARMIALYDSSTPTTGGTTAETMRLEARAALRGQPA